MLQNRDNLHQEMERLKLELQTSLSEVFRTEFARYRRGMAELQGTPAKDFHSGRGGPDHRGGHEPCEHAPFDADMISLPTESAPRLRMTGAPGVEDPWALSVPGAGRDTGAEEAPAAPLDSLLRRGARRQSVGHDLTARRAIKDLKKSAVFRRANSNVSFLGSQRGKVELHPFDTIPDLETSPSTCREHIAAFVKSPWFDYMSGAFVTLNAAMLGVQIDYQARHVTMVEPMPFKVLDIVFCALFTGELVLRVLAYGREFFGQAYWKWHLFDCILVSQQILELCFSWLLESNEEYKSQNLSIFRMTRILRMVRVMRLVRIVRLISELRMLIVSILGSLKALFWAVFLIAVLLYVMSVYLTQLVLNYRIDEGHLGSEYETQLVFYYGSFGDTVLSLYMAVTGGVDWSNILQPVRAEISVWVVPFFMLYVSFVLLCMLNVITGAFVDSALAASKRDQRAFIVNSVYSAFAAFDTNSSGKLDFNEFKDALNSPELQQVFLALDLDQSEGAILFSLLDIDATGHITAEEFAHGVTRLHGPAKALELSIFMSETARHNDTLNRFMHRVEAQQKHFQVALDSLRRAAAPDVRETFGGGGLVRTPAVELRGRLPGAPVDVEDLGEV